MNLEEACKQHRAHKQKKLHKALEAKRIIEERRVLAKHQKASGLKHLELAARQKEMQKQYYKKRKEKNYVTEINRLLAQKTE